MRRVLVWMAEKCQWPPLGCGTMRLLHTSDWHLGRSLHRADLRAAQETFLDHLVDTVRAERVDAVLVAGDVYDRAVPPVDAVRMCEETLSRLRAVGARVVLISGNHDSARRLGFGSSLFDVAGVHLRTRPEQVASPVLLADRHGEVAIYGIPYLDGGGGSAAEPLAGAVASIRAARSGPRNIILSHSWVTGGAVCESERDISLGGAGQVPSSVFDGFSYVALGHLHGRQTLADHIRYSGSPLPYSFSEASHRKGSWLVELDAGGAARAELVPAPVYKRLNVLSDTLPELLSSPKYTEFENDFVSVTLTDPARPEGAMDALRARFPHILVLSYAPAGAVADRGDYRSRVAGRDDLSVAAEFVRHVRNTPATDAEVALLRAAFAAVPGPEEDC
jgi:DNA repair protein SbcD/Mre11